MDVFDGTKLGALALKNRFVRSATWEGMATNEGASTPQLSRLMGLLAEGGAGLLVTSHAYVDRAGQAGPWQLGIYDDELIPGLKEMCDTVHRAGGLIFAQLAHAGANANSSLSGLEPLAPTAMENARGEKSRSMTEEDIAELVRSFGRAARRARDAGFDGVQIHAAHGYCLSQFLSPYYNKRTDRYGGSVENRARAFVEIYETVRKIVGKDYPVIGKINAEDFIEGGLTPEMMVETSAIMESKGLDAMELSGGTPQGRYSSHRLFDPKTPDQEGYYKDAARLYKRTVKMPLILVGGIRSLTFSRALLSEGLADMIALSRPLVREPGLVNRWFSGDAAPSGCVSCEKCIQFSASGEGLKCVFSV